MHELDLQRLATYNAERARGIVHHEWYVREMIGLQTAFDSQKELDWANRHPIIRPWSYGKFK